MSGLIYHKLKSLCKRRDSRMLVLIVGCDESWAIQGSRLYAFFVIEATFVSYLEKECRDPRVHCRMIANNSCDEFMHRVEVRTALRAERFGVSEFITVGPFNPPVNWLTPCL